MLLDHEPSEEYAYRGNGHPDRDENVSIDMLGQFCDDVKDIVTSSRHKSYGAPEENHSRTARYWNLWLKDRGLLRDGKCLAATDVTILNALQKISREAHWPLRDNMIDLAGYAANTEACRAAPRS